MNSTGQGLDDSLTSITTLSTNSSVEDTEEERDSDKEKATRMGQKNTRENRGNKNTRRKDDTDKGGNNAQGDDDRENPRGSFVEVLNSDESGDRKGSGSDKQDEREQTSIRYKFTSLLKDSSSEDDYDEPEGTEGKSESSNKRALQNWRRVLGRLRDEAGLQASDVDDTTESREMEASVDSQYEDSSDASNADEKNRAVAHWERLVTKIIVRNKLLENIGELDKTVRSDDGSGGENFEALKAIINWRTILSKVREHVRTESGSGLKALADRMMEKDTAVSNWERIVSRAINENRKNRNSIATIIRSGYTNNDGSESDESGVGESDEQRSIENWKRIVTKLMKRNRIDSIRNLMEADTSPGPDMDETFSSSSDIASRTPIENWESIVSRLLEKNKGVDISKIFQNMSNSQQFTDEGDDSSTKSSTGRALENWKILASKLMRSDGRDNLMKESLYGYSRTTDSDNSSVGTNSKLALENWDRLVSKLMRRARIEKVQRRILGAKVEENETESSGSEETDQKTDLKRVLKNWERLVSALLKAVRIRELQTKILGRENETESSSDASERRGEVGALVKLNAMKNWEKVVKLLIESDKQTKIPVKQAVEENLRGKSKVEGTEAKRSRVVESWGRMVSKLMKTAPTSLLLKAATKATKEEVTSEKNGGYESTSPTNIDTAPQAAREEKTLRAVTNWRRIASKLKILNNGMRISDDVDGIETCPLCKNECQFPILLSCAHTFCRDCITELIENSGGALFQCPSCGANNNLSDGDEELFCPNFIVLKQIQHKKSGKNGCKNCGKNKKGELVCAQCADKFCKDCSAKHTKQQAFEKHDLIDLRTAENDVDNLTRTYYCLKHKDEELAHYCLTCEASVCIKCARKKHKGSKHDCGSIDEAAMAGRETLEDAAKRLEGCTDFDADLKNIERMQKGVDAEADEMRNEIKEHVQHLVKKLRERERQLYKDVERRHEVIYDALSKRKEDVTLAANQTGALQALIGEMRSHENDVEMLQMQSTVSGRMKEIIEMKSTTGLSIDYDFIFHSDDDEVESVIDNFGSIKVKDRNSNMTISVDGIDEPLRNHETNKVEENLQEGRHDNFDHDDFDYEEPLNSWSPMLGKKEEKKDEPSKNKDAKQTDESEDEEKQKLHQREKRQKKHRKGTEELPKSTKQQSDPKSAYEEIKPQTYQFEGFRQPLYEGFTQLTSERGEQVKVLKFGVLNYKNESCDVKVKMVCPDKSIVSAHVAENADGAFTVFFCPETKKDFNCFITIGGKCFKNEYKFLNFYGDFKGMKSKEIDLACRALSLLRWHITPGLLEKKNGKIKRSRKFMKIIGSQK